MGAKRPDGGSAKAERVTFTRPAAERIASVVRQVEQGDRDSAGLAFNPRDSMWRAKTFRICTYTGEWSIGSSKTVAFKNQTTTPNTVSVLNLSLRDTEVPGQSLDCVIGKDGTAWYLVQAPQQVFRTGFFSGSWSKGASKAVSFSGTTVTVNATNLFANLTATNTRSCGIARSGGTWFLVAAEC